MESVEREYPRWIYHPSKEARIVYTAIEERELGPNWCDSPAFFPKEVEEVATEVEPEIETEVKEESPSQILNGFKKEIKNRKNAHIKA